MSYTEPICFGDCYGTATATMQGSCAVNYEPYTYLWNNGQAGGSSYAGGTAYHTATHLCAGAYTVTITDKNGNSCTQSVKLSQPSQFSISVSTTPTANCSTCTGTATVIPTNGVGSLTYNWSCGFFTGTATGLCPGTCTVIATDANGCTAVASFTIVSTSAPTVGIASKQNVYCNGDNSGSAIASNSGGCAPYTYSWNSGSTTQIGTGLSAGVYTVTVTECTGCTGTASCVITEPPLLTATAASINHASCSSCTDGSAGGTGSGGTPAYNYSWSNGQTNQNATGLSPGTYTVCISDQNGCTACDTVAILNTVGIAEWGLSSALSAWPNPFTSSVALELPKELRGEEVQLLDVLGRKVFRIDLLSLNRCEIDIPPDIPCGVYLLKVLTKEEELIKRVVRVDR